MFSGYQQVLLYGYQMWKIHENATTSFSTFFWFFLYVYLRVPKFHRRPQPDKMRCRIRSRLSDFLLDALLLDTEESNETFLEVWEFFHILDIFKYTCCATELIFVIWWQTISSSSKFQWCFSWNYRMKKPGWRPHFWPCPTWSWLWCSCYSCCAERRVGRGRDPRRCFMFLGRCSCCVICEGDLINRRCSPAFASLSRKIVIWMIWGQFSECLLPVTILNWNREIVIQQWMKDMKGGPNFWKLLTLSAGSKNSLDSRSPFHAVSWCSSWGKVFWVARSLLPLQGGDLPMLHRCGAGLGKDLLVGWPRYLCPRRTRCDCHSLA